MSSKENMSLSHLPAWHLLALAIMPLVEDSGLARRQDSSECEAGLFKGPKFGERPASFKIRSEMRDEVGSVKPWRSLAAEVAQEKDSEKLSKLTQELLSAMDDEESRRNARLKMRDKSSDSETCRDDLAS